MIYSLTRTVPPSCWAISHPATVLEGIVMGDKILRTTGVVVLMSVAFAPMAVAANFACPPANNIRCVPAVKTISGWTDNGGQTTGNSFMPNSECANVIKLSATKQRLLCCYTKCGVFFRDVTASSCTKTSQSEFSC
jgi:hypothetical protein